MIITDLSDRERRRFIAQLEQSAQLIQHTRRRARRARGRQSRNALRAHVLHPPDGHGRPQ